MIRYRTKPAETELGIFKGRDAIYLDELRHTFSPSTLLFSGEFNGRLCSDYSGKTRWIKYDLKFLNVVSYKCWELDTCPILNATCFDVVQESSWIHELSVPGYRHYVLATYDFIYEIVASNFELNLGPERN